MLEMEQNYKPNVTKHHYEFLLKIVEVILKQVTGEKCYEKEPVIRYREPAHLKEVLNFKIENDACSDEELIKTIEEISMFCVKVGHPRFYNQFSSGLDPYGLAGSWVNDALNANVFTYECGPVHSLMEKFVLNDVAHLFGYPDNSEGIFSPGSSFANGYAMNLARYSKFPEIKINGMCGMANMIVFVSQDGHYSIYKMASFLGIGQQNVVIVNTDKNGSMDLTHLQLLIHEYNGKKNCSPLMVVATAGTTVLGAFDPLNEIAAICKQNDIWMHVDAAWGGAAIFSDKYKHLLNGIQNSDSFLWSPQKALAVPQQCSMLLIRHSGLIDKAHSYGASYLYQKDKFYDSSFDLGDKYLQCGRKSDVFKFWFMWKARGFSGIQKHVNCLLDQAEYVTKEIEKNPNFKLVCKPSYINVCFWYLPQYLQKESVIDNAKDISKITMKIKEKMVRRGSVMINEQPLHNLPNFFRFVCCNSASTEQDCNFMLAEIQRIAI